MHTITIRGAIYNMINTLKPNIYDSNVLECYPVSRIRCLEDTAKPFREV